MVRVATVSDAEGIAKVHVDSWKAAYRGLIPEYYLASLSYEEKRKSWTSTFTSPEKNCILVSVNSLDVIDGFSCIGPVRGEYEGFAAEIYAIYVAPEKYQSGIGSRLFHLGNQWFLQNGLKSSLVWVLNENPARRFYERLGGKLLPFTKEVELGGARLPHVAYGWSAL